MSVFGSIFDSSLGLGDINHIPYNIFKEAQDREQRRAQMLAMYGRASQFLAMYGRASQWTPKQIKVIKRQTKTPKPCTHEHVSRGVCLYCGKEGVE
jgi:hypothetical protein